MIPDFLKHAEVHGEPVPRSAPDWQAVADKICMPFIPQSYRDYLEAFGFGIWCPGFGLAVPEHAAIGATLHGAAADFLDDLRGRMEMAVDRDYSRLRRLVCFGQGDVGSVLCWDPAKQVGDEVGLVLVDQDWLKIGEVGETVWDFLSRLHDRTIVNVYRTGVPLQWNTRLRFYAEGADWNGVCD